MFSVLNKFIKFNVNYCKCSYVNSNIPYHVSVCVKFIGKFIDTLEDATKSQPSDIEDAFRKYCKNTKKDDNRFVSVRLSYQYHSNCYRCVICICFQDIFILYFVFCISKIYNKLIYKDA